MLLNVSFSQRVVLLNSSYKTVPEKKKWIIPTNRDLLIETSNGTLQSGTMCNAMFLSNPSVIGAINSVRFENTQDGYNILVREYNKISYSNINTYSIVADGFIELSGKSDNEIVFYPGQKASVTGCLQSLQAYEYDLTSNDYILINNAKKAEIIPIYEKRPQEDKLYDAMQHHIKYKLDSINIVQYNHFYNLLTEDIFNKLFYNRTKSEEYIIKQPLLNAELVEIGDFYFYNYPNLILYSKQDSGIIINFRELYKYYEHFENAQCNLHSKINVYLYRNFIDTHGVNDERYVENKVTIIEGDSIGIKYYVPVEEYPLTTNSNNEIVETFGTFNENIDISFGVCKINITHKSIQYLKNMPQNERVRNLIEKEAAHNNNGIWTILYRVGRVNDINISKVIFCDIHN